MRLKLLLPLLVLTILLAFSGFSPAVAATLEKTGTEEIDLSPDNKAFEKAYKEHSKKAIISVSGKVIKSLPDDNKGSRHQKFLVDIDGKTVLVANNIDLSGKVPVERGDQVVIKGEYIWNEKGGVLHWTHRDPHKKHPDGFIYHNNKLYK